MVAYGSRHWGFESEFDDTEWCDYCDSMAEVQREMAEEAAESRARARASARNVNMQPVDSDSVDSVGYDGVNLYVRFTRTWTTYVYYDVPESIYLNLLSVSHAGRHLHQDVKAQGYRYDQIDF